MQVIAHAPAAWFLLKDETASGAAYYLDVNCSQSAAGFSLLIALDAAEYAEYHALGRVYIEYLAARVNYHAGQYAARDVRGPLARAANEAIAKVRA
jgi:hypothetical protein